MNRHAFTSIQCVIILIAVCLMCVPNASRADAPTRLQVSDLIHRPDRWPNSVTLKNSFQFTSGQSVQRGQRVSVVDFDGQMLSVNAGKDLQFQLAVGDCDLLDSANRMWAALTPAQRAIEPATLAADPSLWPVSTRTDSEIAVGNRQYQAGTEFGVVSVAANAVTLTAPDTNDGVSFPFCDTDVIARARALVLVDPQKRPSRIAAVLAKSMVDSGDKPFTNDKIDQVQIFAFYYGASWCPGSRAAIDAT